MEAKNNWKAWLYLAPVLILLSIFIFYPLIATFGISFMKNYNYQARTNDGLTFDNYLYILGLKEMAGGGSITSVYQYAIPNTMFIVVVTVPLSIIISLLISVALNSIKVFSKVFQTIFNIPYVTNAIAIGMVFSVIFANQGLWNTIFGISTDVAWIKTSYEAEATTARAMFALCVYIVWHALPYKILILLSGLQGIDKQYYDAAKIDATPRWKVLLKITVPLLSPQILYIMITSFIGSFKEYMSIVGLFNGPGTYQGGENMLTIVYFIYNSIGMDLVHIGSAAAVLLFVIIMSLTVVQFKVTKTRVHY